MLLVHALLLFYAGVSTDGSFTDPEGDGQTHHTAKDRATPEERTKQDVMTTTAHSVGDVARQGEANDDDDDSSDARAASMTSAVQYSPLKRKFVDEKESSVATSGVHACAPICDPYRFVEDKVEQRESDSKVARMANTGQTLPLQRMHVTKSDDNADGKRPRIATTDPVERTPDVDLDADDDSSMSEYADDIGLCIDLSQPTTPVQPGNTYYSSPCVQPTAVVSSKTVTWRGTVGPSGTVEKTGGHAMSADAGAPERAGSLIAPSNLIGGKDPASTEQLEAAADNLPAAGVVLSGIGGSPEISSPYTGSSAVVSSSAVTTGLSVAIVHSETARSSAGRHSETASLPTAAVTQSKRITAKAFTSYRDADHTHDFEDSCDDSDESCNNSGDSWSPSATEAFTSYRDTYTLDCKDSDESRDDSEDSWLPPVAQHDLVCAIDEAPGLARSLQTVDSTAAASQSTVASASGTTSVLTSAVLQSKRVTFVITPETAIKPMDQLIRENGRTMGKSWNKIQTTVDIDNFVAFNTYSGNKIDHPEIKRQRKFFVWKGKRRNGIFTSIRTVWKFLLQALELPSSSWPAVVWTDFENRIFSIHRNQIGEWYRKYITDNGDHQSMLTPSEFRNKFRRNIAYWQERKNDDRPVLTPLKSIKKGRVEFQFGRHEELELYRQYLADAKIAMQRGAN